ncbi:sugar ABC transporter permease [Nocardia colli]|uniref:Sugar ABC transporter permease n=1 Tax=Nocardia colli TaxID=2545717 RepID=A0A5N0DV74_9NOCA|nr:sugar ABC transporter permease [Nocardia colli]KAA8880643.1 sugar ABC transporter permease [Nocardia colli]
MITADEPTSADPGTAVRPGRTALARRQARAARIFVAPNLLAVVVFLLFPLGMSLYLSVQRWDLFGPMRFIGMANFARMLTGDPLFPIALRNTIVFTLGTVIPTVTISLVVAQTLNRQLRFIGIFRTILFLPLAVSSVVMAVVWRFVFDTNNGLLNIMLGWIGVDPIPWLVDPHWAMAALCLVGVWKSIPFATVVLLAAMQGVPSNLYEAAQLDGAGELRQFFSITLPMIRGALSFVLVVSVITTVQAFDQVFVLTGGHGGPETSTYVFGIMIFQNAFAFGDVGYASAIAWLIFLILLALTVVQLWFARKNAMEE